MLYAHHFAKGNSASKDPLDRLSGSGVFGRDPDTIITMTKHEDADCYTVDLTLRNLVEQPAFVIEWDYPLMRLRDDLNPDKLLGAAGRPKAVKDDQIMELLRPKPLNRAGWLSKAMDELHISEATFDRERRKLQTDKLVTKNAAGEWQIVETGAGNGVQPSCPVPCQPPQPPPSPNCHNHRESSVSLTQAGG